MNTLQDLTARIRDELDRTSPEYADRDVALARIRAAVDGVTGDCPEAEDGVRCEYPAGHGPVRTGEDGETWEHGAPAMRTAWAEYVAVEW